MVTMTVGDKDGRNFFDSGFFNSLHNLERFITGIDDDALPCLLIFDEVTVFLNGAYNDAIEFHRWVSPKMFCGCR